MTALIVHAAATWFMVGLIWTIQLVHYPLFSRVDAAGFASYEAEHAGRMGRLLVFPAGVEVVTGAALVWSRPSGVGLPVVLISGSLLAAVWITTALVQAAEHRRLHQGKDQQSIDRLVRTNWVRTALWTARGVLVAAMLLA